MSDTHAGGCHCGNVSLTFASPTPPARLDVRECGCTFCRKHGLRAVSDPAGGVAIHVRDAGALSRYRFGHRSADFLVCRHCGVYVAAVIEVDGERFATVNVNALEDAGKFTRASKVVDYGAETKDERIARRRSRWTPVTEIAEGE